MTVPKRNSSTNAAIAEALNTLNSRIEKTETDFIGHLQKVENRLDQLVDLTKQFALLHQHSMQQSDQITEIRNSIRENQTKSDAATARIHTRLDEVINHQRDKLEIFGKEFDMKIERNINNVKTQVDDVSRVAVHTDSEFKKWFNRGWGAWAIVVLVFGTLSGFSYKWLDSVERDKQQIQYSIGAIEKVIDKQQLVLETSVKDVNSLKQTTERMTQMNRDLEQQIDIIRRGK